MTKYLLIITIILGNDVEIVQIPTQSEPHCKHVYKEYVKKKNISLFGRRLQAHGQCLNLEEGK